MALFRSFSNGLSTSALPAAHNVAHLTPVEYLRVPGLLSLLIRGLESLNWKLASACGRMSLHQTALSLRQRDDTWGLRDLAKDVNLYRSLKDD